MKTNHRRGFVMGFGYSETSLSQCEQQGRNLVVKREGKREIEAQLDDKEADFIEDYCADYDEDYDEDYDDTSLLAWLDQRLAGEGFDNEDAEWEAGYRNPYDEPMLDDGFDDWLDDDPDYYDYGDEFIPPEPPLMAKPIVFKKYAPSERDKAA